MNSDTMEQQKILCVDDEPGMRNVLSEMMTQFGYDCEVASDGLEALERLEKDFFSIVITDLEMPKMNGLDLIREIAKEYPDIDTIAITAYNAKYQYTDLIEIGASDFITKPFHMNELQAKLNRIIRERNLKTDLTQLSMKDGLTNMNNRRSFDIKLHEEVRRVCRHTAHAYGCSAAVEIEPGYPVTVNDETAARRMTDVAGEVLGRPRVAAMPAPIMGAEDFSYVLARVPGALGFLGACPPRVDPATAPPNRSSWEPGPSSGIWSRRSSPS